MERSVGYSLWLIPSDYEYFKGLIDSLAKEHGSVAFRPHLTLYGDILGDFDSIAEKAQYLAGKTKPFKVRLSKVESGDKYFKCVYAIAESEELVNLNKQAQDLFGKKDFQGHLSLLYGNYPERKEIAASLNIDREIVIKKITIVCGGYPPDWNTVEEFSF